MRIAITATGPTLDATVDPRFGRCAYFLVVDADTMAFEAIENPNIALGGGAGIQSAQLLSEKGVQFVLTGNCGPNAYHTLAAANIGVIIGCSGAAKDIIEQFKAGQFDAAGEPNVASHFGTADTSNLPQGQPMPPQQPPMSGNGMNGMGMGMGRGQGRGMGRGVGRGMGRGQGQGRGMGQGGGGGGGMGRAGGGRGMGQGQGMGRGMGGGMGRGRGMGMGAGFTGVDATPPPQPAQGFSKQNELAMLKQQAEAMTQQTEQIQERIRLLSRNGDRKAARVDVEKCTGCGCCIEVCPVEAIKMDNGTAVIDKDACIECGQCVDECPNDAIIVS